ncbi:hypothetical protein [Rubritalea tangerina]|uniref:hypothetical protein n=1 Tax=Rubritalea tangerina TaxID=430798 RepID=UPI0036145739
MRTIPSKRIQLLSFFRGTWLTGDNEESNESRRDSFHFFLSIVRHLLRFLEMLMKLTRIQKHSKTEVCYMS